ncbi:MAG: winged helix DNA-binding protein [Sphingomonadales bacterium]|nr:winged helix DNA-binding protein [Sphingomonadales bacterium]
MVNSVLEIALPDVDPLSNLPGYALRRAANAMMAELATRLGAAELRISDASVLLLIAGRDDMTSSEIGKVLDIQRANMVPLLGRLETAGLIHRVPLDRKSQAIVLTDAGEARLAQVRRITDDFESDLMARIPSEHRPHFVPALQALVG